MLKARIVCIATIPAFFRSDANESGLDSSSQLRTLLASIGGAPASRPQTTRIDVPACKLIETERGAVFLSRRFDVTVLPAGGFVYRRFTMPFPALHTFP